MTHVGKVFVLALAASAAATLVHAAGVRDFTRTAPGTAVSAAQASELTLTLTDVAMRPIQNSIRTAGTLDEAGTKLTAFVRAPDADLIQVGQRAQAYTVNSRTRKHLGKVTGIAKRAGGANVEVTLPVTAANDASHYLTEIVVERGPYLSIPNVSIIEEGNQRVVYVQKEAGRYVPQPIKTGLQGELYTQVLDGVNAGDQVVSVGSFFVDAENKLRSAGMAAMPGMDHGSMPGMDHSALTANTTPPVASGTPLKMVTTDPAPNARAKAPVSMIHVMFNAPVDPKVSRIDVTGSDGKVVDVGEAQPMGDTMLMAMPKTPLPAGTYKVKWRTMGAGAKPLEGEFSFTAQ